MEFEGKVVNIKTDSIGKEWFCSKDACKILGFKNINQTLLNRVRKAYKTDLKSLIDTRTSCATPLSYNDGKVVYLSEAGLYQLIFSSRLGYAEKFRRLGILIQKRP